MSDHEEIFDLTVRYATAIDRGLYALLKDVFTDKAVIDYGVVGRWTGGAEIAEFMERAHLFAARTLHRVTNQAIDVHGDTATVRTYIDALILLEDGAGANPVGYYDDTTVRTPVGWRIDRRTYTSIRLVAVGS